MKNYVFIAIIFLTGFSSSYSQQEKLDSLLILLQQHKIEDSIKVDLFNELAYNYYLFDPAAGLKFADSAILLAGELKYKNRLAKAYAFKGHNYSAIGQDSAALAQYARSIEISNSINDHKAVARTTFSQGLIYFGRAEYLESTKKHREALEVFSREKDTLLMAKMWNSIGINYMYLNDYPRSLESFLKASTLYEAAGHTSNLDQANIFANLGILYKQLEDYELALDYQKRALKFYSDRDFKSGMANSLISIGNIQDSQNEHEQAIRSYRKAYLIGESISNNRIMAASLTNTGIAFYSLKQYDSAVQYLDHTRGIYEELGDDHNLAIVYNYLGEINMVTERNNRNPSNSEVFFNKALDHSLAAESLQYQRKALENLSGYYYRNGNYKRAYEARTRATQLKDSMFSLEKKEELVRLEMQHEFQKKEAVLRSETEKAQVLAGQEIRRQKLIKKFTILSGSGLLLLITTGLFFYKKHRDVKQLTRESEFKARIADTELKVLRSQMNPHFIFNSLNSIKDYISRHETKVAEHYLIKFARLMRLILESSEKELLPLEEDLQILELYMQLEAVRLENKFTYDIEVAPDIDPINTLVPPLLLQPFIENSIWHGIARKSGNGRINIRIKKKGNVILCIVEDDGVGFQTALPENTAGKKALGIKITRSRLEILNKLRNTRGGIQVISKEPGVRVEVELPVEMAF